MSRRSRCYQLGVVFWALLLAVACATRSRSENAGAKAPAAAVALQTPRSTNPQATSSAIPIEATDAVWGHADAPVTIVAFLDLECPFCTRVEPTLELLKREYGPERLRVVVKHFPLEFHAHAREAAEAAQAVLAARGPEQFFEFVSKILNRRGELTSELIARTAAEVGVPSDELGSLRAAPNVREQVSAHVALAARVGVTGTPQFLVNGAGIDGAQPAEAFREVIDRELEAIRKLAGTPPGAIYGVRVAENFANTAARAVEPEPEDTTVYYVPIDKAPVLGKPDALVTIVEFSDFECPFCARAQQTMEELRKLYPDDVRFVFRHNPLPFHERALPAAQLALEVRAKKGDAAFWDSVGKLFENSSDLSDEKLLDVGKVFGLSAPQVRRALERETHPQITSDQELALDLNARGTPHFFINGRRLAGAQPITEFQKLIDGELARAKQLVQTGVPAARFYDEIMKTAARPEPPPRKVIEAPTDGQPSRGAKNAPVVVQVFSDFQCPFCARVRPTVAELEKRYAGKLRIVWRDLPLAFHTQARPAAIAAREALAQKGAAGFWKMHDLLFDNQSTPGGLERAALEGYAAKLGLDVARFRAALGDGRHDAAIDRDLALAQAHGINGTPSFVIGEYFVSGAQPLPMFARVVEHALKDAQARRGR